MKPALTFLSLFFLTCSLAFAQNGTVRGKVTDQDGTPLISATVVAEGTGSGTVTDENGNYSFSLAAGTYNIVCSYVGYATQESEATVTAGGTVTLNFSLVEGAVLGQEIVVSGSRKPEKLTESPATIETIFARELEEYAGNAGDLIARQKGVDYFRAGVATPAFNIRGFNSNFNSKNLQVTDGRFSTLIATGLPFGPLNTTIEEDIERFEIILGPNATLYGPNAHNGLANIITKDPRTSAGTTAVLGVGNQSTISARLRHAQVLSDKFAFKVSGEYTSAEEFEYSDSVFIDRVSATGILRGQPGFVADGIKEGYEELELNNDVSFLRGEGALYFSPSDKTDIILNAGYSNSNYLSPTNVGRNQIIDWQIYYTQLRITSGNWFGQIYYTGSKTEDTYSIDERTKQYYNGLDLLKLSDAEARGDFSYTSGALFKDDSKRWNAEIQYNNTFGKLDLVAGGQWQNDRANSLNTYLLEREANDFFKDDHIIVNQYGGYAHLTYNFSGGWRVLAAARADYHDVYEFNFVPKFGLLHVGPMGTWRLTYGLGIASPTILNMFGSLFNGLILGNAEGFTLVDGRTIEKQKVEKLQTFELGYRGQLVPNKLFIDANAYYNISEDFLSPLTVLGVATLRGDQKMSDVQSGFNIYNGLVASYVNFGLVNTYGADLSLTYYFTPKLNATFNYSFFDWSVDEDDPENDFDRNGTVDFLDILVNAPNNKASLNIGYSGEKFFGSLFTRWVEEYDYFSSFQIASKTHPGKRWRGFPIVEDARSADTYNYGPLAGFVTFDIAAGYRLSDVFTVSASVSNLFDTEMREFTAAPPTGRLMALELRVNLPAIGSKN